jgi:ribonuclease-3
MSKTKIAKFDHDSDYHDTTHVVNENNMLLHESTRNNIIKSNKNKSNNNNNNNNNTSSDDTNNDNFNFNLSEDEIRDRLLNEKNIPITEDFINNIFKKVGFNHKVKNLANFQLAMIHSTYSEESITDTKIIKLLKDIPPINPKYKKTCIPLQKDSYERLEYLGDSILRHTIGKYLYIRYPNADAGFLTTNRSKMENTNALSDLARKFGLQNYAVIPRNMELLNARSSHAALTEDIFEAFIGALNLETDENKTLDFLWKVIEKELDLSEIIRTRNNYKDRLMQYFHKAYEVKHDLQYYDQELLTDDGKRRFKTIVKDKATHEALGVGKGRSKKMSQQRAAKDALIKLELEGTNDTEDEYFDYAGNINIEIEKVRTKKNMDNNTSLDLTEIKSNTLVGLDKTEILSNTLVGLDKTEILSNAINRAQNNYNKNNNDNDSDNDNDSYYEQQDNDNNYKNKNKINKIKTHKNKTNITNY